MSLTITHTKTNTIPDWDQQKLDAAISAGLYPPGTRLADIVLPSDWNASHTVGELSITSCTFANLPSPASSYTGQQRIVTDYGNSAWYSDGTRWVPVNNVVKIRLFDLPVANFCTFTPDNGANTFTLGTAHSNNWSTAGKFQAYIPSGSGLTAGFFTVEMTSTTQGKVYSTNGVGFSTPQTTQETSTAFTFTSGTAVTGSTSELTLKTLTIPGNLLWRYGEVFFTNWITRSASGGGTATYRIKVNGTAINSPGLSSTNSTDWHQSRFKVINGGASILYYPSTTATYALVNGGIGSAPAMATTSDLTITLTVQHSSATELSFWNLGQVEISV